MFLVQGEWELEDAEDGREPRGENEEETQISLHAISGVVQLETMRLWGNLGGKWVLVMINSGSTHNFLDPRVVMGSEQMQQDIKSTLVTVARGQKLNFSRECRGVELKCKGQVIRVDVKLLRIGVDDMILGIQWLRSLGPITWDLERKIMRFQVARTDWVLRAINGPMDDCVDADHMKKERTTA